MTKKKENNQIKMPDWKSSKNNGKYPFKKEDIIFVSNIFDDNNADPILDILEKMENDFSFYEDDGENDNCEEDWSDAEGITLSVSFQDLNNDFHSFGIFKETSSKTFKYREGPWWNNFNNYVKELRSNFISKSDDIYQKYLKAKKLNSFK